MSKPVFSFVMPVYNKVDITYGFCQLALESIYQHTKEPFEVICIDNASPVHQDMPTQKLREQLWGKATVISLPENIGFGQACNMGFRLAQGDYVVCMNSDAELVEDSASILRQVIEREGLAVAFPESFDNCMHYKLQKSEELMLDWFFGAFWVGRRDAILSMGGFDPYYEKCYYEDTDLWSRLFAANWMVAGWRGTWVKHKGNASAIPEINELLIANRQRYIDRWGTDKVVKKLIPKPWGLVQPEGLIQPNGVREVSCLTD